MNKDCPRCKNLNSIEHHVLSEKKEEFDMCYICGYVMGTPIKTTLIDMTNGKLKEAIQLSRRLQDNSLVNCLRRLKLVDKNCETVTMIMSDSAPYSFEFARRDDKREFRGNGGVIFHGKHDNGGDGSAPTFSVNLTPTTGWSIHT